MEIFHEKKIQILLTGAFTVLDLRKSLGVLFLDSAKVIKKGILEL